MRSLWASTTVPPEFHTLQGKHQADAVVIGGGLAGILTASFLQEKGLHTIILEANTVGSGQSQNTTAKITSQHGMIYQKLIQSFGEEAARQYARANEQAIFQYQQLILEKHIHCQFQQCPAYIYSVQESSPLQQEAAAAEKLGLPAEFTKQTALPFKVEGAVKFHNQAQFHPLKFLYSLAENLEIYEHSRVISVENNRAITETGDVQAKYIIFATHFPFVNMPGYYFARMHQQRSYVLALENAFLPDGMYLGIDKTGLSMRSSGKMLLLGGGSHRTGENSAGGKYQFLRSTAQSLWPESIEKFYWSAQDCITTDSVPYIGQFSSSTPNWYVATGFQKWGITSSMVAATIITNAICGKENPNAKIFSPQRFPTTESVKGLLKNTTQAVKGLTKEFLALPKSTTSALSKGHGGVVEYGGEKIGVYKDKDGEIFTVSTRCPHLGCQLEWNPDELTWDCPCHGSRFDYKGNLLNNPAQEDLPHA